MISNPRRLLGLAVCTGALILSAAVAAQAQDTDDNSPAMTGGTDTSLAVGLERQPAGIDYPYAAPGTIDMYHFRSFRKFTMQPGSIADARWRMEHQRDIEMHRSMMEDEAEAGSDATTRPDSPFATQPTPVDYPFAPPGNADMMHFRSYRRMSTAPGSVADAEWMRMHQAEESSETPEEAAAEESAQSTPHYPMPVDYPFAAPDTVDMVHFETFRGITVAPGSPTDVRYRQKRQKMMQQHQEEQQTTPPPATGSP